MSQVKNRPHSSYTGIFINRLVGAKSAPAGKVDLPSESEGSGHSDDDSSISSQDSGMFKITSGFLHHFRS